MTIPVNVSKVSLVGSLPGSEIFDTGFWIGGPAPSSATAANDMAESVRDHWEATCGTSYRALLRSDCAWTGVKVYAYPSGGPSASYVGEAAIASGTGTSFAADMPLQVSMCATLRTQLSGRRHRGRMFLPWTGGQLTSHQFSQTVIDDISSDTADFFAAINADGSYGQAVVVSQVGSGAITTVSTVSVDSLPDIQRRRANRAAELRQSSNDV